MKPERSVLAGALAAMPPQHESKGRRDERAQVSTSACG
jgi:hypothetical protein